MLNSTYSGSQSVAIIEQSDAWISGFSDPLHPPPGIPENANAISYQLA